MPTKAEALAELARRGIAIAANGGKPVTEDEGKSRQHIALMNAADLTISRLEKEGYDPGKARGYTNPWAMSEYNHDKGAATKPGLFASEQTRSYDAAALAWVDALLRSTSGANAPPAEVASNKRAYFPVYGDSDAIIKQKAQMRQAAMAATQNRAGPLGTAPPAPAAGKALLTPKAPGPATVSNW